MARDRRASRPGWAAVCVASAAALGGCERPASKTTSPETAAPARVSAPASKAPVAAATAVRVFVPSAHGFRFRNNFPGVGLPTFLVGPEPDAGNRRGPAFGLCGGMSAAAADYFLAGRAIPSVTQVPTRGSVLYEFLYLRQAESIGPGVATALRFVQAMRQSDNELRRATEQEIPAIRDAVRLRGVAPIGLVLARFGGPPGANAASDNHQVLALAVRDEDGHTVIDIYDPNYPGDDAVTIILDGAEPGPVGRLVRGGGSRSKPVRGLLVVPYTPRTPPADPA